MKKNSASAELKIMKALSALLFALAAFSVCYFTVIVVYAGFSTSYCFIWLVIALIFILMGHFVRLGFIKAGEMPRMLPTFIFTTFILFAALSVSIMTVVIKDAKDNEDYKRADYTVVLGARVYENGVSKTLMYRLERALEYYGEHPDTTLVLTGGQENGDIIPEALAMFNYFSMHGVPSSKMIIDTGGKTTAGVISRAADRIAEDTERRKIPKGPGDTVWAEDHIPSVAIITSDYHMMRAVRVAETLGIEEPVTVPAKSDKVLFIHQCVRESAAIVKDYLMGNFTLNEREIPFKRTERG